MRTHHTQEGNRQNCYEIIAANYVEFRQINFVSAGYFFGKFSSPRLHLLQNFKIQLTCFS